MIVVAAILVVIMFPVLWILFVPVNIKVNTSRGLYQIKQAGTITMSMHPGETPLVRTRIFGFMVDLSGRKTQVNRDRDKRKLHGHSRKKQKSLGALFELLDRVIGSFRCRRFYCDIDFDDVVLNAELFPVGYFVSRGPVVVNVNFEKRYLLDIWIQIYIHRMLWAFVRFYLTK